MWTRYSETSTRQRRNTNKASAHLVAQLSPTYCSEADCCKVKVYDRSPETRSVGPPATAPSLPLTVPLGQLSRDWRDIKFRNCTELFETLRRSDSVRTYLSWSYKRWWAISMLLQNSHSHYWFVFQILYNYDIALLFAKNKTSLLANRKLQANSWCWSFTAIT